MLHGGFNSGCRGRYWRLNRRLWGCGWRLQYGRWAFEGQAAAVGRRAEGASPPPPPPALFAPEVLLCRLGAALVCLCSGDGLPVGCWQGIA